MNLYPKPLQGIRDATADLRVTAQTATEFAAAGTVALIVVAAVAISALFVAVLALEGRNS